jgi:hypothetical protein
MAKEIQEIKEKYLTRDDILNRSLNSSRSYTFNQGSFVHQEEIDNSMSSSKHNNNMHSSEEDPMILNI